MNSIRVCIILLIIICGGVIHAAPIKIPDIKAIRKMRNGFGQYHVIEKLSNKVKPTSLCRDKRCDIIPNLDYVQGSMDKTKPRYIQLAMQDFQPQDHLSLIHI